MAWMPGRPYLKGEITMSEKSILVALLCCPDNYCQGAVKVHVDEPEDRLAEAAKKAARTGNVKDLREYLRLHRIYF